MNKFSTLATAAALAFAAVAPVGAEEAKVSADPFVSSQNGLELGTPELIAGGVVVVVATVIAVSVADGSSSGSSTTN